MCARYSYDTKKIRQVMLAMADLKDLTRGVVNRINHAPTMCGPIVRVYGGEQRVEEIRWGLVLPWTPAPQVNAKSETVMTKKTFAASVERRRCLVITGGFYEWEKVGRARMPWQFSLPGDQPLVMAGIWDAGHVSDGHRVEAYCILTTQANDTVGRCHDRMPVILDPRDWEQWIDPSREAEQLKHLWRPWAGEMDARPVSPLINKVSYQEGSIELEQKPVNSDEPLKPVQGELF